jgi:hypothetical protein
MKKKIGLVALLFAVAAAGAVFAQSGRQIRYSFIGPSEITIHNVEQTALGLNVSYSCSKGLGGDVVFTFRSFDTERPRDPNSYVSQTPWKEWTNTETLITAREYSTFRFTHSSPSKIVKIEILASKKNSW